MTNKQYKLKLLKKEATFSLKQLAIFVIVFGAIGGYVLWHSFAAAPVVATLEAERMALPAGAIVINDTTASAGQSVKLGSPGSLTGSVSFPSSVTSLTVNARATAQRCKGSWPSMSLAIDGNTVLPATTVASTGWTGFSANTNLSAATHTITISYTKTSTFTKCNQALYVDVTTFYGPAPPPTPLPSLSLAASPTSLTAGGSSTLTWNSTNANSCTASGAWSGSQPTSGSTSTGALNATSTYSLTCTGSGGSATASTTVTVTAVSTPPPARYVGFSSHIPNDPTAADAYVARLKTAHITAVRDEIPWSWTSSGPGTYNWTRVNTLCTVTKKYNLKLVVQIGYAPKWANGNNSNDKYGPLNPADYGTWAKDVALKLQQTCPDVMRGIEYWNEPNISFLYNPSTGKAGDPLYYTQLANAAYTAVKGAGVTIPLWGGSTSGVGQTVWNGPIDWTETCLKNGIKFDQWSSHPYYFGTGMSGTTFSRMDLPTGFNMNFSYAGLETLDKLLARYGYSGPIHGTELGVPTDAWPSGTRVDIPQSFGTTSEAAQVDWFNNIWPLWSSKSRAGDFYIYTGQDSNSSDLTTRENHFGSFHSDGSSKPLVSKLQATW